ncbi:hypothetical protein JOB18_009796 [Solea senegalensis]|uniref:Uncharacterized protein n=1 Tax=Solea senegalensis TaxID=28829 RepID=A0AAV6SKH8_SOLSE|nr:hypothetical protein JOB18_009796 [Solea senegalensis]KAG7517516.1 hypothetical protein JOB18_009796 [Solea senegalensis]
MEAATCPDSLLLPSSFFFSVSARGKNGDVFFCGENSPTQTQQSVSTHTHTHTHTHTVGPSWPSWTEENRRPVSGGTNRGRRPPVERSSLRLSPHLHLVRVFSPPVAVATTEARGSPADGRWED